MTHVAMERVAALVDGLGPRLAGDLLVREHQAYDDARRVHNGLVDKRPAVIARCLGTADVQAAVRAGREHGLEIAVRGGGHNPGGFASCDGGLVIDLSRMRGVEVDARARRARAQGGATWADYNRETQLYGLASTGGVVSSTGVGGLTLGGGLGWLMGSQGLALDCVRRITLVTATGDVVQASADEQPDLFWALRGGGGNFGVATSFEYEVSPVGPTVLAGLVAHPFSAARDVLRFYRDFTARLPDDLTAFAGLLGAPDGSGARLAAIMVCHIGEAGRAAREIEPVRRFGSPVVDGIAPTPYAVANTMFDEGFPKGALNYWKANYLQQLSDATIDTMIARFDACPSPMSAILLEHFHGAATRVDTAATAFAHRRVGYNLAVIGEWTDPAHSDTNIAWVRQSYDALSPDFATGRYFNYLSAEEGADASVLAATFGPNWARLRDVKRRYDPDNVFHLNQNIRP